MWNIVSAGLPRLPPAVHRGLSAHAHPPRATQGHAYLFTFILRIRFFLGISSKNLHPLLFYSRLWPAAKNAHDMMPSVVKWFIAYVIQPSLG
jgi:hypothetical protein